MRARAFFAGLLGVLGILAIIAGILLGYFTRTLFNAGAFADRAAESLANPGVARLVATRIADSLIAQRRDLIAYRPIIISTTQSLVTSAPFRAIVRRAARSSHQLLMSQTGKNISLTVADAGVILRSAFEAQPALAAKIPDQLKTVVASVNEAPGGRNITALLRLIVRLRLGAITLIFVGIILGIISVIMASEKRLAILRIGITLALAALVLRLVVRFGGDGLSLFAKDPLIADAFVGLWQTFLNGLMIWALVLGLVGLVLIAAVTSLLEHVQLVEITGRIRQWFRESKKNTAKHLIAIFLFLSIGIFIALFPTAATHIFALLAGMLIFFVGLREFFSLILGSLPEMKRMAKKESEQKNLISARTMVVAVLGLLFIGTGIYLIFRNETTSMPQTIDKCNGFAELCDRQVNDVVFPAAHNAMSAADIPAWLFPNHEKGIQQQLDDGIRAFLIDTHYGTPVGDKIKTLLDNEEAAKKKYEEALGKEGIEAAMRIRDRLIGDDKAKPGIYLCHGFCELGASSFNDILIEMREFMVSNPNEVVIIINQDEGVTPKSIESSFTETGLIDFVYRGSVSAPWPTLREMIASDQRILVFAENNSEGVEWYHSAFQTMQETPYSFHDPKEFSCRANRGDSSGSLFLMNHWIDSTPTPKPSNAQIVNSYDFLLKRARQCQEERKMVPNLIAVDFYKTGNLFQVVETLNGIRKTTT